MATTQTLVIQCVTMVTFSLNDLRQKLGTYYELSFDILHDMPLIIYVIKINNYEY